MNRPHTHQVKEFEKGPLPRRIEIRPLETPIPLKGMNAEQVTAIRSYHVSAFSPFSGLGVSRQGIYSLAAHSRASFFLNLVSMGVDPQLAAAVRRWIGQIAAASCGSTGGVFPGRFPSYLVNLHKPTV